MTVVRTNVSVYDTDINTEMPRFFKAVTWYNETASELEMPTTYLIANTNEKTNIDNKNDDIITKIIHDREI